MIVDLIHLLGLLENILVIQIEIINNVNLICFETFDFFYSHVRHVF